MTHDAVAQATVIHSQSHGSAMTLAQVDKGHQCVANALQLDLVFLGRVGEAFELAGRVDKVAGIDAHLVGHFGCLKSGLGVEMNVGNERHVATCFTQCSAYFAYALSLAHALGCESHIVASCLCNALALLKAIFNVVGVGVGHRLHPHKVVAAQWRVGYLHSSGGASLIVEVVHESDN
ncbi:Uncharacterised protein [Chlamydia trachomatis]|nr:Uncharacterised protein [Chlamydia trachomatis]